MILLYTVVLLLHVVYKWRYSCINRTYTYFNYYTTTVVLTVLLYCFRNFLMTFGNER